jgi:amino acid transporter
LTSVNAVKRLAILTEAMSDFPQQRPTLRRALGVWWLVFYGVGVTIGAGIFALIGEIVVLAGDYAPLSFLLAGVIALFTGLSYAVLSSVYPRAAGEALYVRAGLGEWAGRLAGLGLVFAAITSSAVISLSFARYLGTLIDVPEQLSVVGVLVSLGVIAWIGVRESVGFAALITVLETGTLLVIILAGLPQLSGEGVLARFAVLPADGAVWMTSLSGAFLAFFAFIGFEDIVNMAEETEKPESTIPAAVVLTLGITVAIYLVVAVIAAAFPDRDALAASKAPLALLFERTTGIAGAPVAAIASIAMINGILVQIIMASRVLYGMATEGMIPGRIARLDAKRQTPVIAIAMVVIAIIAFTLLVPFLSLAELTSLVILAVFAAVNLSLFLIGRTADSHARLRRWRWWGAIGALISAGLIFAQVLG